MSERAVPDMDKVERLFAKVMVLFKRKCKSRCTLKRILEEYCVFRLGALYFEGRFNLSFEDESKLVECLKRIIEDFEVGEEA